MHEALLWRTEGDRVHCHLCPHSCRIADGRRGVCGVRENQAGALIALTYAEVSSVAADPIEKKPVYHFHPGTKALSLGSVGCTMRCQHCQNWRISRVTPDDGSAMADGLQELPPEAVPELAARHGCQGVAFTYNEPVIWVEYVTDVSKAAKEAGLYTVMVTNGYVTEEGLDTFGPHIDVWRVDLKGMTDETYRDLCKVPHVQPVLDGAVRAKQKWGMHVEVVTNVVPSINDSEAELHAMARWIRESLGPETPWHVTRFFPYLELSHLPPTPVATLRRAREIGRDEGLYYVYLGNLSEEGGEDTTCPGCGHLIIERDGYRIVSEDLAGGTCPKCGNPIAVVS